MTKTALLVIDPQFDFCDPTGALYVKGADADMARLGNFMVKNYMKFSEIQITLDSHHTIDIAHPVSWVDSKGKHPNPFTIISEEDVKNGTWRAFYPGHQKRYAEYVSALAAGGRYPLCIWPPHCLIGTIGATIVKPVVDGMLAYENQYRMVGKVSKGSNIYIEHYSAVKAEVEDPQDPFTKINKTLIDTLKKNDKILITGQAASHCVANTVRDIADVFSDEDVKKFVYLEDTSSAVTGFEALATQFVSDLVARGMTVATTQTYNFN